MIRTRIAPSPTGFLHIGTIEIALFNIVYAKQNGGKFIIRIEDTDRERYVEGAEDQVYEMIEAYGLDHDESPAKGGSYGPYRQSDRLEIYKSKVEELVDNGSAYPCFCSKERLDEVRASQQKAGHQPKYDGKCRDLDRTVAQKRIKDGESYVIRLKVPFGEIIEQHDMLGKSFRFNTDDLDDQILMKSDGYPTYYLAVVVDDFTMEITHVLKGKEWQSSDPKLLILYKAFGLKPPVFGYLPLLLDPDGGKLSKRKGSVSAKSFLVEGYIPEAILNYLMLMGWNPGDEREIFSFEEFTKEFDVKKMNSNNAVFDRQKLLWMNGYYLRHLSDEEYLIRFRKWLNGYGKEVIRDFDYSQTIIDSEDGYLSRVIQLEKERAKTFKEMFESIEFFFVNEIIIDMDDKKYKKLDSSKFEEALTMFKTKFEEFSDDSLEWDHTVWENIIREIADKVGYKHGDMFMLLRFVIVGKSVSPELFATMRVLGKGKCLGRIRNQE